MSALGFMKSTLAYSTTASIIVAYRKNGLKRPTTRQDKTRFSISKMVDDMRHVNSPNYTELHRITQDYTELQPNYSQMYRITPNYRAWPPNYRVWQSKYAAGRQRMTQKSAIKALSFKVQIFLVSKNNNRHLSTAISRLEL